MERAKVNGIEVAAPAVTTWSWYRLRGRTMRTPYLLAAAALLATGAACADRNATPLQAQTTDGTAGTAHAAGAKGASPREGGFHWGPAPAVFPPGAEMALLQGDPSVAGEIFTVRLRFPNGYILPAHWHPTDEHVTVVEGTLLLGMGDRFDEDAFLPPLRAGGFITAPARMNHFVMARGRTVVQVHAMGPFALTYANPADDPQRR
jgi:hypothetical protein